MNVIPTRVHAVMDYVVGAVLIAAPWLLRFERGGAETWVPVIVGIAAICYSLLTRYELGLIRVIPMDWHLGLDFGGGVLLLISPWLFGFAHVIAWPHVVFGLLEMAVAILTRRTPYLATMTSSRVAPV